MKYKTQILTRVESLDNQINYLTRQIDSATISGKSAVDTLKEIKRKVESIKQLIEAEM